MVHDTSQDLLAKVVSIAYPTMDILLLAGALRLAVDAGRRAPSFYLLAASIVSLLATDFIYSLFILRGTYNGQWWLDAGWISYYLCWGAAALHPSMRSLEEPAPEREVKLSRSRLVVLTIASLIAPATQVLVGGAQGIDMRVMIASSSSLFLLVVARMAVLVRQQERSVERERALRAAGLALVAATARDQIAAAALAAARTLTGPTFVVRLGLLMGERLELIDEHGRSEQRALSPSTTQRMLVAASGPALAALPIDALAEMSIAATSRAVHVVGLEVRDEARGVVVAAGPSAMSSSQLAALQALATSVSLALESTSLTEDIHRRESEARFSSLVARSSDLITVIAADGTVLYQSPSIERVLGYATERGGRHPLRRRCCPRRSGRDCWPC